eukprot:UN24409
MNKKHSCSFSGIVIVFECYIYDSKQTNQNESFDGGGRIINEGSDIIINEGFDGGGRRSERTEEKIHLDDITYLPFFIALFFGVHAIHAEAVCNTTGRAEVLYTLFYLLGFISYIYSVTLYRYMLVQVCLILITCTCTVASVLSKENGITLPVLCTVWHFIYMLYFLNQNANVTLLQIQKNWLNFFFRFLF